MVIDSTFWVAVSFIIFFGVLVYLKLPQKINEILNKLISDIKNEIDVFKSGAILAVLVTGDTKTQVIDLARYRNTKNPVILPLESIQYMREANEMEKKIRKKIMPKNL